MNIQIGRTHHAKREDLLKGKDKQDGEDRITVILTYHPAYKNVWQIFKDSHQILHLSDELKELFPKTPRIAFRNGRSLKDQLVHASISENKDERPRGNYGCRDKRCNIHKVYLTQGNTFKSSVTKKEYQIKGHFNCNSECIVYLITCRTCKKQYVGSTITRCRDRFNKYPAGVRNYGKGERGMPQEHLFEHFHSEGHNGKVEQMELQIIDRCHANNQKLRESYWSFQLKTFDKRGLNGHLPLPSKQTVRQLKNANEMTTNINDNNTKELKTL